MADNLATPLMINPGPEIDGEFRNGIEDEKVGVIAYCFTLQVLPSAVDSDERAEIDRGRLSASEKALLVEAYGKFNGWLAAVARARLSVLLIDPIGRLVEP
jgi:hypothetical protein